MSAARLLQLCVAIALALGLALASSLVILAGWGLLPALAVGLLLGPLTYGVLLGLEFLLTTGPIGRNQAGRQTGPMMGLAQMGSTHYHGAGGGGAVKAWLSEIPIALHCFGLAVPFGASRTLASGSDPAQVPVLLVHGYLCNRAVWGRLARWLAARGHPVLAPTLDPWTGPMDAFSGQIHRAVQTLRQQTGATQVALVGHSMGGVAIRAYLRDYGAASVHSVVTLGAPHQGTWLGSLSTTSIGRDLTLNSPWLKTLAAAEQCPPAIPFTTIISDHDNIVSPQRIQTVPGARLHLLAGYGHLEYLYKPAIWQLIADAIAPTTQRESDPNERSLQPGPDQRPGWPASANREMTR